MAAHRSLRGPLLVAALAWSIFVVYGSLVPFHYRALALAEAIDRFRHLPPLWFGMGSRADWVANILLFIPFSFLWMGPLAANRRPNAKIAAALFVLPMSAAAAVALEFTQIWFAPRTVSINDIVAETLGGTVGIGLWLAFGQEMIDSIGAYFVNRSAASRFEWMLRAYLIGFVVFSVLPLDLTISLTELYHKYQSDHVQLVPFRYPYDSPAAVVYQFLADIMVLVPVGALFAIMQHRSGTPRSHIAAAFIGGGTLAALIEFAQLLVLSRYTDITDVILGTAGAGIGGWLVGRRDWLAPMLQASADGRTRPPAPWLWLAAIAFYSLFLIGGFWFPFEISHDRALVISRMKEFLRMPLLALYQGTEFNAINQVLLRILLFAPLGMFWAFVANRAQSKGFRRLWLLCGLLYSAGLALGIEAGEILMPRKVGDVTEVFFCVAGAVVGLYATSTLLTINRQTRAAGQHQR